jgi:hypothetical protein
MKATDQSNLEESVRATDITCEDRIPLPRRYILMDLSTLEGYLPYEDPEKTRFRNSTEVTNMLKSFREQGAKIYFLISTEEQLKHKATIEKWASEKGIGDKVVPRPKLNQGLIEFLDGSGVPTTEAMLITDDPNEATSFSTHEVPSILFATDGTGISGIKTSAYLLTAIIWQNVYFNVINTSRYPH